MKERCKERIWKLAIAALLLALIFIPVIAARGVELSVNAPEEVGEGSTFEVSIDVEKIKDLNSGKFDLSFDSSVVNVTGVADGSLDGTTIPAEMWIADEGIINVIVDIPGITGVSGSGNLAKVSFEVVGEKRDRSELVISNVQLVDDEAEFIPVEEEEVVAKIKVVEKGEEDKGEEEQPPDITAWEPTEDVVNSTEDESMTFEITVDQEVDISWRINGTEAQTDESETETEFTKSAVAGTWNVSVIATSTETGLSSMHTWIWSVTPTSMEAPEETPTPTPTSAPGVTPSPTPTLAPGETPLQEATPVVKPKPTVTPTAPPKEATPTPKPAVPGLEAVFAIAAMTLFLFYKKKITCAKRKR